MLRNRRLMILPALAIVFSACGAAATPTAAPPTAAAPPTTVDVTLQEWAVVPASTTLTAGKITFNVKNVGPKEEHEMVVIKTDLGPLDLPKGADGKVDESGAGLTTIGEVEEVSVGGTGSVTLDLAPGKYLFICNIVDADDGVSHYGKGMTIAVTVQ
jgi:uncharacterized cupredoxin-like copper-binding protein